jgi:hypothetical protein
MRFRCDMCDARPGFGVSLQLIRAAGHCLHALSIAIQAASSKTASFALELACTPCTRAPIHSVQRPDTKPTVTNTMANPNRTDYEGEPLSGPGILWINSKVTDPASLPVENFTKWYEQVHIPDIIAAGSKLPSEGIVSSWRYKCLDTSRPAPFLAVYKVPDMGFLQSPEFKGIPMTHESLPDNGPIHRFAEFDARFLGHVETWSSKSANGKGGRARFLISEAIEPAESTNIEDFHKWYRSVYVKEVSSLPGWRRTSRFNLVFKKENKDDPEAAKKITPKWLALHEFDVDKVDGVLGAGGLLGKSQETKNIDKTARKVDVAAFEALSSFGRTEDSLVDKTEQKP